MTTRAENDALTRVGPGTPGGEMFRRYWLPVGVSADLKAKPTLVRVLAEDLVLFRDGAGRPGLLGALCSHRRANLALGSQTARGLQCRYHGWQYDVAGRVIHTPGEPPESDIKETVQHTAYPCQEMGGLIFAYMGPAPAPLMPRYDFLAAEGERHVKVTGIGDCNWLQCVENGIDPLHVSFTHGDVWTDLEIEPTMGFEETPWGLVHKAYRPTEHDSVYNYREHHLIMPGISIGGSQGRNLVGAAGTPPLSCRWSVPIDDDHTLIIRLIWKAADNPGVFKGDPLPRGWRAIRLEPYKEYRQQLGNEPPELGYTIPSVIATEDATILESMPAIVDRENEHLLTYGDFGIQALRAMYLDAIQSVADGRDPRGTFRDEHSVITVPAYEFEISEDERRARQATLV
jgi:nitrite reductase/ring-hydroxylating ferredoxin subunit